jgi:DNA repair exonuclease SbcCD ATPase subunit
MVGVRAECGDLVKEIADIDREVDELKEAAKLNTVLMKQKADAKTAEAEEVRDKILTIAIEADTAKSNLTNLGDKPSVSYRSRDEVYRARQARDGIERELESEKNQVNPHYEQVSEFNKTLQIIDYDPLNDANTLLKHQDFLFKLLSNKDSFIRKKIIDQNLSYLNSRLNHYLDKLGLPHEVRFQSDLNVEITNLGRDFDFEQLSRGEMNRVIMATSWSFRDIWESTNISCNLLWVDELLDQGTDGQGVEAALGILKAMARDRGKNVFLISHREELQARIDRTLLVRKENGFTTLEADGTTHG